MLDIGEDEESGEGREEAVKGDSGQERVRGWVNNLASPNFSLFLYIAIQFNMVQGGTLSIYILTLPFLSQDKQKRNKIDLKGNGSPSDAFIQ